jgi:S-adenosylmethionine:tRNA ribosyltransferase-isomerase
LLGREVEQDDKERFQTIYASQIGAVAAPSAGLHFSRELMKRLEIQGVNFADVTLHIGLGAFRPVEVEDLTKHKSESENFIVPETACDIVNAGIDAKKRICAVGTTTMRAIESSVAASGHLKPVEGWTDKFIFPPYDFSIANSMVTNFHLPESTLLMMAAAFAGYDKLMHAYEVAQKEKYRFFTYGDAMLII